MDIVTIIFASIVFLLIFGSKIYIVDKLRYGRQLPPGPLPLPFIGTLYYKFGNGKQWLTFSKVAEKFGPISLIYAGQQRLVVLSSVDAIRDGIVANSKAFNDRPVLYMSGYKNTPRGVLFESGETWQRRRRFLMRSMRDFGMGKLQITEQINSEVEVLVDKFEKMEGQSFNPRLVLATSVSNIICSVVFGKRFSHEDAEFITFFEALELLVRTTKLDEALLLLCPIPNVTDARKVVRTQRLYQLVGKMLEKCLSEHRKDFDPNHIRHFPDLFIENDISANNNDEDASAMSFEEFRNMMGDMFLAGSETTSTVLQWTLLCFAKWPEIQRKCHDAVDVAMGGTTRLPTLNDRANLVYLDAVFHEVLRFVTIAPLAIHGINSDQLLGGFVIPEKTAVLYNIWGLHHDQGYWGDSEEFDPSRWIDAKGKLINHSTHFMPFGVGPRICLGESLARVEYFIFLVALLQRFTISLPVGAPTIDVNAGSTGVVHLPPACEIVVKSR